MLDQVRSTGLHSKGCLHKEQEISGSIPHRGQRLVHDLGTAVTVEDSHTKFEDCALSAWRQGRSPYHPGT
jgi:hypothetical protein